jgi:hypothetical protein
MLYYAAMKHKDVIIHLKFTEDMHAAMRRVRDERGVQISWQIRMAVRQWLKDEYGINVAPYVDRRDRTAKQSAVA